MSFMGAYKHLDNLCRDMNGKGISGYIEDMEQSHGRFSVPGWEEDYKALKHYRWVRNQIAHETYADEENMCESGDAQWLETFYERIMNETDPIALAYQKSKAPAVRVVHTQAPRTSQHIRNPQKANSTGCATAIFAAIGGVAFLYFILFYGV